MSIQIECSSIKLILILIQFPDSWILIWKISKLCVLMFIFAAISLSKTLQQSDFFSIRHWQLHFFKNGNGN